MCTRPINIPNNSYRQPLGLTLSRMTVQCGHCVECLSQKSLSWFIRLYYQHKHCLCHGGFTYYLTLTYNDANIPYFFIGDEKIKCFSKRNIQLYLKRLRKRLPELSGHIKYFLSSEYGSLYKRPHHHVLLFVDCMFDKAKFARAADDAWSYGFTCPGKLNAGFIAHESDVDAINYVAKYVTKDVFEEKVYQVYIEAIKDFFMSEKIQKHLISRLKPFHVQSTNLGVSAFSYNDYETFCEGKIKVYDKYFGEKLVTAPTYYIRKMFYDVQYRNPQDHKLYEKPSSSEDVPTYVCNSLILDKLRHDFYSGIKKNIENICLVQNFDYSKYKDQYSIAYRSINLCTLGNSVYDSFVLSASELYDYAVWRLVYKDVKRVALETFTGYKDKDYLSDFMLLHSLNLWSDKELSYIHFNVQNNIETFPVRKFQKLDELMSCCSLLINQVNDEILNNNRKTCSNERKKFFMLNPNYYHNA